MHSLPFPVSRENYTRLECYAALVIKWNASINLISPKDVPYLWQRHIADSAQLYRFVEDQVHILDIGSGAGFPGLVLAILGAKKISLIESDHRKMIFLKEAARQLDLHPMFHVKHSNQVQLIEEEKPNVITARALAPLVTLLSLTEHLRRQDTFCLFLKGKNWAKEIDEAQQRWSFDYEVCPSQTTDEGRILRLCNIVSRETSQ